MGMTIEEKNERGGSSCWIWNQLDLGAPNGNVDDGLVLMLCVVSHEEMPTIVNAMWFWPNFMNVKTNNSPKAQAWT